MLVQTSMAHAFANLHIRKNDLKKINSDVKKMQETSGLVSSIQAALRTKQGTINVPDRINLTSGTYRRCRAVDLLPAHMM